MTFIFFKRREKKIVDKYAYLVIGHPKDLNSRTKIAHHATTTQDIKTG
jgi:hypothetical protein